MKRRAHSLPSDQAEINVSPLIDMVFILLIFFIVATSFVNEVGITPKYKDSASPTTENKPPLTFRLSASGQILQNGSVIGIEEVAPIVRTSHSDSKASILVQVSPGSKAGLATEVMDQALLGGAKAIKLSPLLQ
ncbi:MAG: biopolymer transporter ExbD [Verrucomicrobia bacterium TMED60]|jgi:biopolymer transport protein ExbD|nr:MAG: biopolymer transporter ExbD [Verrucomicrobia bacterium TMED60]|tara:strand:- start:4155 stop:4556 length:402 start_codon:yes stop_codon:yes gene_type:complete